MSNHTPERLQDRGDCVCQLRSTARMTIFSRRSMAISTSSRMKRCEHYDAKTTGPWPHLRLLNPPRA